MSSYDEMRFERRGGAPDLQAVFTAFVKGRLRGRSLDDHHSAEGAQGEFPDFGALRDLVLIEMKHLEADQQERVNAVLESKIDPGEWPLFFGRRTIMLDRDSITNADDILGAVFTKLSRTVEGLLSKANRQLESYRRRHPRKNQLNICVILNSRLMEYTPEVVSKAIHSKMKVRLEGAPRFPYIDAVLYLSEKHYMLLEDKRVAHPVTIYEGMGSITHEWKVQIIHRIVDEWAQFRTGVKVELRDGLRDAGTVEDIPERMSRSDAWLLEYARNPYLSSLDVAALRARLQRLVAVNSLTFVKGNWPRPTRVETAESLRQFHHIIAETNRRGIDMREMAPGKLTPVERDAVFAGLPQELVDILRGNASRDVD